MDDPREENAEMRRHFGLLLDAAGIIVSCRRQGIGPEPIFYEALEDLVAQAGAFLLTTEQTREGRDDT